MTKSNNSLKKNIVILWHQRGKLANQLWNFMSAYAYCLEKGYELKNYCFYEYGRFFSIPVGNTLVNWLYFKTFPFYRSLLPKRQSHYWRQRTSEASAFIGDSVYSYTFVWPMEKIHKSRIIRGYPHVHYLPPTQESEPVLKRLEQDSGKTIYFYGWLFRNPVGLQKYRQNILSYFQPVDRVQAKVQQFIRSLRSRYRNLVGVHIRQTDYRKFEAGRYYVSPQETAIFARQYLQHSKKAQSNTCFVICSDEDVNLQCFGDLNVVHHYGNVIKDLFVLASTDAILGSNSSYGALASWYGNIPHIIMLKEGIDWNYYKDKHKYFENKYNTVVHF